MGEDRFELLITVVVGVEDDRRARAACQGLLSLVGGRIVESGDCSAEEPGCWSVTIRRPADVTAGDDESVTLSRAIRRFLRRLGPEYGTSRVSCEPPTAWTVLDDPELLGAIVPSGERLLVEAWSDDSALPDVEPDRPADSEAGFGFPSVDQDETPAVASTVRLRVEVQAERQAGAHWQARAVASRLASRATILRTESADGRTFAVTMDLGSRPGPPDEVAREAAATLGKSGWSRLRVAGESTITEWAAASPGRNGLLGLRLAARQLTESDADDLADADGVDEQSDDFSTAEGGRRPAAESAEATRGGRAGSSTPSKAELLSVEHRRSLPRDEQRWSWWSQ
ncbi:MULTISPECIES: hypothetical protein [Actinoalloteichus]|uniref:Uncharacterized protein n=1 Tax=Actinoalloteichus fjordicus TaxID=1612552 RepID=A0AAC9PUZ0_9PSEU|nr:MULTISPECIES: hypothetical protein [Actinoalloteichus]APU17632.1 hypothetical protein UA74_28155 [Actinoalloteichus fjordicus]APU23708.1 hypothetical protein UA75_28685 [Actinoalloteichus sp. GBA129-24]